MSPCTTRRVVPVEVLERVRHSGHARQHDPQGQPRVTALGDESGQWGAVDPVHDEHIRVVVEEEVVAHARQRGMRRYPEERFALLQQSLPRDIWSQVTDLERDDAIVLAIDGANYLGRALATENLE